MQVYWTMLFMLFIFWITKLFFQQVCFFVFRNFVSYGQHNHLDLKKKKILLLSFTNYEYFILFRSSHRRRHHHHRRSHSRSRSKSSRSRSSSSKSSETVAKRNKYVKILIFKYINISLFLWVRFLINTEH